MLKKIPPNVIAGVVVAIVLGIVGVFVVRGIISDDNALGDMRDDITIGMGFPALEPHPPPYYI